MELDYTVTDEELNLFLRSGLVKQLNETELEFKRRIRHLKELETIAKETPRPKYVLDMVRYTTLPYTIEDTKEAIKTIALNRKVNHEIAIETKGVVNTYLGIEDVILPSKVILLKHFVSEGKTILDTEETNYKHFFPKLILIKDAPAFSSNINDTTILMSAFIRGTLPSCEDYCLLSHAPKTEDDLIDNLYTWMADYQHITKEEATMHEALHSIYFSNKQVNSDNLLLHATVSEAISFKISFDSIMLSTIQEINQKYNFLRGNNMQKVTSRFAELNSQYTKNLLLDSEHYNQLEVETDQNLEYDKLMAREYNGQQSYKSFVSQIMRKINNISYDEEYNPTASLFRYLKEDLLSK